MTLSEQQLDSFIELFKKEEGIILSRENARFKAESLLFFVLLGYGKEISDLERNTDIIESLNSSA